MKVLVTGGAGFVGSHLVDALIARGDEVVVIDHHKKDKRRFPNERAKVYKISLSDPEVENILQKEQPDVICHLAAQISVPFSVDHPIVDAQENILDPLRMTVAAQNAGVKKFIFASSGGAIYGDHPVLPTPEVFDAKPISPYGVSKQAFERHLAGQFAQGGIPYVALRFANLYGPRQMMHGEGEGGVIAIFLSRAIADQPITINGDGNATRDFVFVEDAVNAFLKAIDSDYVGVVNIATGIETSINDLARVVGEVRENPLDTSYGPERMGDIKRSVLDPTAAETSIGWKARTSFKDGLRKTYEWFREHLA